MATANPTESFAVVAERRIGALTVWLGLAAAVIVALTFSTRAGAGVAVGTALAWINYRWLQQALDAMRDVAVAQHPPVSSGRKARIPWRVGAKFIGRYVLIGVALYVIVAFLAVPVLSVFAGLFALGAATMVEGIYEAVRKPV